MPPGQRFVEQHPERVDVGPDVDEIRVALELLRRRVGKRARELTGTRHVERRDPPEGKIRLGDAEVEDVGVIAPIDEQIRGLEVAVNDAALMGVVHRPRDARQESHPIFDRRLGAFEVDVEVLAVDELHHHEPAFLDHAAGVEMDDVRMLKPADDLEFALHATSRRGRLVVSRVQEHLERDGSPRLVSVALKITACPPCRTISTKV